MGGNEFLLETQLQCEPRNPLINRAIILLGPARGRPDFSFLTALKLAGGQGDGAKPAEG